MEQAQSVSNSGSSRLSVAGIVGGIALLLSTILSGSGIYFSLMESSLSEIARIAISTVSTLFLTLLAFRFWLLAGRSSRERRLRREQAALPQPTVWHYVVGGLLMSLLSVMTATTALVFLNNRDGVQALMNHTAFAATIKPVDQLAEGMSNIAAIAARTDNLAADRSQQESTVGGTCGVSPPGAGPLTRMRASHAALASVIADRANALNRRASEIARSLISARNQDDVNKMFDAARSLRTDPERLRIAEEADALAQGYAGAGFIFEGRLRNCPDTELAALFDKIAETARGIIELPTQPPLRRDVRIFDAFAMVLPILLDEEKGRAFGVSRATILPFVLFTVLIDLVSLGGALGHGAGRAKRMTEQEERQIHRTSWVLRNFVWEFPALPAVENEGSLETDKCQAFVFVPLGGDPDRTRQAEYLTALFDLSVDPAFQFEPLVARRREFEPWVEQMRLASGNATHYAIYPIKSQEVYEQIMRIKRDALKALALTEIESSEFPEFGGVPSERIVHLRAV